MNSFAGYYTESLYPLQDGVLKIVQGLALPFYLTGGAALSRHYFGHHYSDDLDLFVNKDSEFNTHVAEIFAALEGHQEQGDFQIRYESVQKFDSFATFHLIAPDEQTDLKIDLVNEQGQRHGILPLLYCSLKTHCPDKVPVSNFCRPHYQRSL